MEAAVKFRVILDHDIKKLCLPGMPHTVKELEATIKQTFGISMDISLQRKDQDFDDFVTLSSIDDLKDRDTLKVVYVPPVILFSNVDIPELPTEDYSISRSVSENDSVSQPSTSSGSISAESDDTIILSPRSPGMHKPWPTDFPIPKFSYNTELVLQKGNENYLRDGSLLCKEKSYPGVKSNILECLAELISSYTPYPSDAQRCAVAEALIKKNPCLKEPGSFNGLYGWQQSLKYKVGNYRSKLRMHGIPEVLVNSLKRKSSEDKLPAKNIKKPRKAEVNYLPPHPAGETEDSLESNRLELISETKKKNNGRVINEMMSRTFSLRRQEIVGQAPSVADLLERWPALFEPSQICEEFLRISGISLESTFMSQLDRQTPKLLSLFNAKGGAVGQRIKLQMMTLIQDPSASVEKRREVVLRCLIEYMGERQEDLISVHHSHDETEVQAELGSCPLKIYMCHQPDTIGIIIEGQPVVRGVPNLSKACCLLFGLTYALDLKYPSKLVHTFEIYQRLFVGLDPMRPKPSSKYANLLTKLS
ncbi:hypothetical protein cypCar_00044298 [Cyprinus carpio]|uniref:Uncharacterized protein n=2 Tax=Cyprinus carpio carpio TaxID=630221 RepID=A0A9J8C5X1_CYPCA|nr:hypothetical protein cypCar_00044298 [Cyprinus carpio]